MSISWVSKLKALFITVLLGAVSGVWAQSLEVTTPTELRATPALDAKVLVRLERGTRAEQIAQRGGWVKVQVERQEGWVRLTHVAAVGAAATSPSNPLTGLGGIFSATSSRPTATTGTRGLTQEQLANAQPAPAEVRQLERYAVTSSQAEQYAREGKVWVQRFPPYSGAEQ